MKKLIFVLAYLLVVVPCTARTITVDDNGPADFNNIQAAINAAVDRDEIIVSIGTYYGKINFNGKNIILRSTEPTNPIVVANTVINGRRVGSVVTFSGTESAACILSGFTIINGIGTYEYIGYNSYSNGGGIYGNGTLATIQYNIISRNYALFPVTSVSGCGGGIYNCNGIIQCNIISENTASQDMEGGDASGGGLFGCDGIIQNNIISNNRVVGFVKGAKGGGLGNCNGTIRNNTIFGNSAGSGGGLSNCTGIIINCIIWQNAADIDAQIYASSTPSYCCIQDWSGAGAGNISDNPNLFNPESSDFHLRPYSPCIDIGASIPDLTDDFEGDTRPLGSGYDIGADEINNEEPLIVVMPRQFEFFSCEGGPNPEPKILYIWNAGADVIDWQIIEDCEWLDAWPRNGVSTGQINEVTLTVDASWLGIGSYSCSLEVHDPNATNSPQTISVDLHVFSEVVHVPSQMPTIQGAIDHVLDGGTVIVADGVYTGPGNQDMDFKGKPIKIISENGPSNCIIDCNGTQADPHRGFHFHKAEDADSVLNGFTITNGYALGDYASGGGGAVLCEHSSPLITNCIIVNNLAAHSGGGIICWEQSQATITNCAFTHNIALYGGGISTKDSNSTVINCIFTDNSALGGRSGGDSGGGVHSSSGRPLITGCTFIGNTVYKSGGGIHSQQSRPKITNCTFNNNSAGGGGGVSNYFSQVSITNCTFTDNKSYDYYGGGGIYNYESDLILKNCSFMNNSTPYQGGGVSNFNSNLEIVGCMFNSNSAGELGGGMYSRDHSSLMLTNCVFSENVANERGGGINNYGSDSTLTNCLFTGNSATYGGALHNLYSNHTITNCTFIGNSANYGGAVFNLYKGSSTLTNCILWGNTATISGNEIYLALVVSGWDFPSEATVSYSDVKGGSASVYIEPLCTLNWGSGNIDADPCFLEPGYWVDSNDPNIIVEPNDPNAVWLDGDYHLLFDSPCIDTGDPNYVAEPNETDLDGNPRIFDGDRDGTAIVDMGAYEFNHQPIAVAGPNQIVYAWLNGFANINLDGSASYDDDNDVLDYYWSWTIDGNIYEDNGINPTIKLPVGIHTIELVVDDGIDLSEPDYCTITVIKAVHGRLILSPKVVQSRSRGKWIIATLFIPPVPGEKVNTTVPLRLYPSGIKAKYQYFSKNRRFCCAPTFAIAFFDKQQLIDALGPGRFEVDVVGQFLSGCFFFGSDTIRIISPPPPPPHHRR